MLEHFLSILTGNKKIRENAVVPASKQTRKKCAGGSSCLECSPPDRPPIARCRDLCRLQRKPHDFGSFVNHRTRYPILLASVWQWKQANLHLAVKKGRARCPRLPHHRHALRRKPLHLPRCHRHAHTARLRLYEHLRTITLGLIGGATEEVN